MNDTPDTPEPAQAITATLPLQEPVASDAGPAPGAPAQEGAMMPNRFADVVSGQFDADESNAEIAPRKRVLAPMAETPKLH